MSKPKIHTMQELSKAIGVSRPTLARFFENEASVLPSTSVKIKERLQDVDYVYNFLATRQNRKNTGLFGVIIPHFEDLFLASLLASIENAARAAGKIIITQSSHGQQNFEEQAILRLRSMNVDGAIIVPLGVDSNHEAFLAAGEAFPIVFADSRPSGSLLHTDFVGTNNSKSFGMMIDYLCRSGPAPVYLTMPKLNLNAVERQDAYCSKMRELGHEGELIPTPSSLNSWDFESYGFQVMDAHFAQGRYTSATILCGNDRIAIGAIRAANTHGLFLRSNGNPIKLRIAGHDDHPLSRYIYPALTTVAQQVDEIGKRSVDLVIDRARNGFEHDAVTTLLEGTLKIRDSA